MRASSYKRLKRAELNGPRLVWDLSDMSDDELGLLEQYLTSKLPDGSGHGITPEGIARAERLSERIPRRWVWGR